MSKETKIIKAADLAQKVKAEVAEAVAELGKKKIVPHLRVVVTVSNPAVEAYVNAKKKIADALGIELEVFSLGRETNQHSFLKRLQEFSADETVHGVIIESPLRDDLSLDEALEHLDYKKDIDGLTPANLGLVLSGHEEQAILSATPQACIVLAETQGGLEGKNVTVVGRGRTVGRPLIAQLINRHATVTVTHSKTADLTAALSSAEVVVVGIGRPKFINDKHLQNGQIVVDAGINVLNGKLVGDVDTDSVLGKVAALTPVPGGVGTLTTAIIFKNLIKAIKLQGLL